MRARSGGIENIVASIEGQDTVTVADVGRNGEEEGSTVDWRLVDV